MTTRNQALRGVVRGPYVIPAPSPMKLQCPKSLGFETASIVDVSVYQGYTQVMWQCHGCSDPNFALPVIHCAVLPAAAYVAPDVLEVPV